MLQEAVIPTELSDTGNRAAAGVSNCNDLLPWTGEMLNSECRQSTMLSLCATNLKNPCGWSCSAEGPDSDAFDEELYHEFSQHRASPCEVQGGCLSICLKETSLALGTVHEQSQKLLAQTVRLPHMELDDSSKLSTPPEMERVMDCSLRTQSETSYSKAWHTPLSSRTAV